MNKDQLQRKLDWERANKKEQAKQNAAPVIFYVALLGILLIMWGVSSMVSRAHQSDAVQQYNQLMEKSK